MVKIKQLVIPLITGILVFGSCCITETECIDAELKTFSLEKVYGCVNTKYQMDIDLFNDFKIIRSSAEFQNSVSGSCFPEIDFAKYDLIIGKQGLTSGNQSIDYFFKTDCENDRLLLTVTFNQNITTVAPNLTYHVLIEKLDENDKLEVEIEIVN